VPKDAKNSKKPLPCGRIRPSHTPHVGGKDEQLRLLQERLDGYTKGKGLNSSASRNHILEIIAEQGAHFSPTQLIQKVSLRFPNVGPATVYRNLTLFIEAGVLRQTLTASSGETLYEVETEEHHDHIVCLDCNEIFEFHDESIEKSQDRVASSMKFKPENHWHVIYARCEQLKRK
jgi:Fur family ferric uptake transcriptional regulator